MICELFPEGDFYIACKIKSSSERLEGKAVNNHKISPKQTFEKMGKTSESPAQKAVLVNCLACYLLRSSDTSVLGKYGSLVFVFVIILSILEKSIIRA